uniref:Uncharacterized protein n=1 Tax=Branchiostoma floridae TaxID=7739 RepID=C3YAS8_BRAFL|eukprot:XP_002606816.1 hypothetical protein BRAFLDRAFT_82457 [Branchiostoma floridae]
MDGFLVVGEDALKPRMMRGCCLGQQLSLVIPPEIPPKAGQFLTEDEGLLSWVAAEFGDVGVISPKAAQFPYCQRRSLDTQADEGLLSWAVAEFEDVGRSPKAAQFLYCQERYLETQADGGMLSWVAAEFEDVGINPGGCPVFYCQRRYLETLVDEGMLSWVVAEFGDENFMTDFS